MEKLTLYDSYEDLKASKNRNNTDEPKRAERNAALEHFVEQLRNSLEENHQAPKPADTDERDINQTDCAGL